MLARGRGRIVNVSSGAGFAAVPMLSAYVVSKTALYRLSENLAAETRGHGVTVFAIDPGLVRTAISESALSCGEPSTGQWFTGAFATREDVSAESAAALVVCLAPGAGNGADAAATDKQLARQEAIAQNPDFRHPQGLGRCSVPS
jgi:short-subunit dehydrogenase